MFIQRIDREKEIGKQCERIVLVVGDKSDCQKATENGDCRYYEKQEGAPINEHPLKNEVLGKIKSGEIVFS